MQTIAYLANEFPSKVEPYVREEISELRRRGLKVIAGSIWKTEEFTCPGCGVDYTATREEHHEKRTSSFKCSVCDTEVFAWSGYFDFFNWRVVKEKLPVFGRKR